MTLFLALSTDDLGFVFEVRRVIVKIILAYSSLQVTGGIGAAALAYVMPAACYLKLAPSMPDKERLAAKCCVGFGTAITVLVLFKTIWNAFA